ncbi:MAG: PD-(D/E)XK nuclease family protein [Gammaproteobacteria bacterium]|nr:PD-(D/E)XK nuclease family protein [Gammaproteobacteria bacterium]
MYDWLTDALGESSSQVVTANRRLARTLVEEYGQHQIKAGLRAWRRPQIHAWGEWLAVLVDAARHTDQLPVRINAEQSRLLWEQSLAEDIDDPLINIGGLARLCRDTWLRLHQWRVPLAECQNRASGQDQRIFARAAAQYASKLAAGDWIDDAQLPEALIKLIKAGKVSTPNHIALAGFDRMTPQVEAIVDALVAAGATKHVAENSVGGAKTLKQYANQDAELRAAGAWARAELEQDSNLEIAIVVSNLEKDAEHSARLLREGLIPGWQYAGDEYSAALDLSYGRRLTDFPAIHAALLLLRWLHQDLKGTEVSLLLRSPFFGLRNAFGRGRLELKLRDWPDRHWSRQLLLRALVGRDDSADAIDWLERVAKLDAMLKQGRSRRRPSEWAEFFDDVLKTLNWPGEGTLTSADFQLDNRWRGLLNEFARLELVSPVMAGSAALSRLASMAGDTIFQPEADSAVVRIMGPLEAAGMQFDRVWVTGLAAAEWPPQGHPLVLMSRDLQRDYGMPDADPEDTAVYAQRVLQRLNASAGHTIFSYPAMIGDAEQMPTALLADVTEIEGNDDPGWHAETLRGSLAIRTVVDKVPAVSSSETISGGAATINRQFTDPFSAFAFGRLGVRWLPAFKVGIAANVRGNLLHAALCTLYSDKPTHADICSWSDDEEQNRVDQAIDAAFKAHERYADSVLQQLFMLERRRSKTLLRAVVNVDRQRAGFSIGSIENEIQATLESIHLNLRCDRIDRLDDGQLIILDYKTGKTRKFLTSGEPNDWQLIVYACVVDAEIAGLGLFNVDSKHTMIDGAGPALTHIENWKQSLQRWQREVLAAAADIAAGDVRLNVVQNSRDARPLSLLSRFAEIRREP